MGPCLPTLPLLLRIGPILGFLAVLVTISETEVWTQRDKPLELSHIQVGKRKAGTYSAPGRKPPASAWPVETVLPKVLLLGNLTQIQMRATVLQIWGPLVRGFLSEGHTACPLGLQFELQITWLTVSFSLRHRFFIPGQLHTRVYVHMYVCQWERG